VAGINEKRAIVVHYQGMVGSHELQPSCSCVAGLYHCETQTTLASLVRSVEDISGSPLRGLGGSYYGERFALPGTLISGMALEQDRLQRAAEADRRKVCKQSAAPNVEDMMEQ
jgi:hypothetical protein